jgi:polyisoprenoid-binding protein YceI
MEKAKWVLEPQHSEVEFNVRHMMISNVTGYFKKFSATIEVDGDDLTTAKAHFTADVDSISTNNEQRDGHLKSADFFDMKNHQQIKFEGVRMERISDKKYKLHGSLTMRGITHPISLDVEYGGTIKDPWGNTRAGFTVEGKLNRKDYGLNWSELTETGGLVAGNEVKLHANVEFIKSRAKGVEQNMAEAA